MNYKYFTPTQTREEIKNEYRRLAKLMHPDLGGNTADMQALNAEYDWAMNRATRNEMPNRSEGSYAHQAETNKTIREAIEKALKYSFLNVELCGWWVWVDGTKRRGTNPANDEAIDALKAAGYRWHNTKAKWYFASIPTTSRGKESMSNIRATYGSKKYKGHPEPTADTAQIAP